MLQSMGSQRLSDMTERLPEGLTGNYFIQITNPEGKCIHLTIFKQTKKHILIVE